MANLTAPLAADVDLLNAAIGIEQEAQYAYKTAAGTGLLSPDVLAVATKIAGQHADHEKAWTTEVQKLGGTPPTAKSTYTLPTLSSQTDILKFALGKEINAANAYFDVIQKLSATSLKSIAGSIMNAETTHVITLASALGLSPLNAMSFMPLGTLS